MVFLVLPVFNEEENLDSVITSIRRVMGGKPYRIIAVNDGSTDRTPEILASLKKDDLTVIGSTINMNVGAVFAAGIAEVLRQAKDEDVMIIMESDQTSEIDLILPMAGAIADGRADIVVASRYQPGGSYQNFPFSRRVFSHGANRLLRSYFPLPGVMDYTIFFRAYRVGLLRRASQYFGPFGLIQSKGFVANAELLVKLALFTSRIVEVPFVYHYGRKKGKSKLAVLRTINEYFVFINYFQRILAKHRRYEKML